VPGHEVQDGRGRGHWVFCNELAACRKRSGDRSLVAVYEKRFLALDELDSYPERLGKRAF